MEIDPWSMPRLHGRSIFLCVLLIELKFNLQKKQCCFWPEGFSCGIQLDMARLFWLFSCTLFILPCSSLLENNPNFAENTGPARHSARQRFLFRWCRWVDRRVSKYSGSLGPKATPSTSDVQWPFFSGWQLQLWLVKKLKAWSQKSNPRMNWIWGLQMLATIHRDSLNEGVRTS